MKKFLLLTLILAAFETTAYSHDYDPQNTMLALNMAIVSVHRILTTQNRAILDDEYQNIINNLNLGSIKSDPEITSLYEKLLDITSRRKLRNEEAEFLRKNYNEQSKRSISSALKDMGKTSAAMIREDGSIGAFFGSFGNLVSVSAASYFKYQIGGVNLRGTLEENMYRLNAEDLADFNGMQKQLLSSSWNLVSKYNLPDDYRLVQRALDDFNKALDKNDNPSQKLRMLQALESDFLVYPPYWLYRAKAAQECKDSEEAAKCYDKFSEVWRPVLRKDPYMLETAKYRISRLVDDGVPYDDDKKQIILEMCRIMRENTLRDDWVNNIFAGAVYYALGEKQAGIECTQINIDFGYELELSSEVLRNMKLNVPPGLLLNESLRALKLNELTAKMTSSDKITAMMIADYFDDREGAFDALSLDRRSNAVIHALRLASFGKENFSEICRLAETQAVAGDEISHDYAAIMPVLKNYSDDENAKAQAFIADMYLYGWGKNQDTELAMYFYSKAAEKGEIYPQIMYVSLSLQNRNVVKPETENHAVIYSADNKHKNEQKKEKKPLIRFWPFKR